MFSSLKKQKSAEAAKKLEVKEPVHILNRTGTLYKGVREGIKQVLLVGSKRANNFYCKCH